MFIAGLLLGVWSYKPLTERDSHMKTECVKTIRQSSVQSTKMKDFFFYL